MKVQQQQTGRSSLFTASACPHKVAYMPDNRVQSRSTAQLIAGLQASAGRQSEVLQCFKPYQPPILLSPQGLVVDLKCPDDWRVDGESTTYTNYHTVAYTLLCEGAKKMILGLPSDVAIERLRGEMVHYFERIQREGGRSRKSRSEAQQVMQHCMGIAPPFTELHLAQHVQGFLTLQQHCKCAFNVKGAGEKTPNGEEAAIGELRTMLQTIRERGSYVEEEATRVKSNLLQLLDRRHQTNHEILEGLTFYLLDVLDEILPLDYMENSTTDQGEEDPDYILRGDILSALREEVYEEVYMEMRLHFFPHEKREPLSEVPTSEEEAYFKLRSNMFQTASDGVFKQFLDEQALIVGSVDQSKFSGLIATILALLAANQRNPNDEEFKTYFSIVENALEIDPEGVYESTFLEKIANHFDASFQIIAMMGLELVAFNVVGKGVGPLLILYRDNLYYPLFPKPSAVPPAPDSH